MVTMVSLGRHVLARFEGVSYEKLNDEIYLGQCISDATQESNMTLRALHHEKFTPQGITIFAILSESHIAIHTWPEEGYAAVECFTCGNEGNPIRAIEVLREHMHPQYSYVEEISR